MTETFSGRYHVPTVAHVALTPEQTYLLAYQVNRAGTIVEVLEAMGSAVSLGLSPVHVARDLLAIPATTAVIAHAESGSYQIQTFLDLVADRAERQSMEVAIARTRQLYEAVKSNPGQFGPSCGFLGGSPVDPEPLKSQAKSQLAICIAGNLTTREAVMSRWRAAPSAQSFEINAARLILDTVRRLEAYARAAPAAYRAIYLARIMANAKRMERDAKKAGRAAAQGEEEED